MFSLVKEWFSYQLEKYQIYKEHMVLRRKAIKKLQESAFDSDDRVEWLPITGITATTNTELLESLFNFQNLCRLRTLSLGLRYKRGIYRGIILRYIAYCVGKGFTCNIVPKEGDNDKFAISVENKLNSYREDKTFYMFEKEFLDRLLTDGEVFVYFTKDRKNKPLLVFLDPGDIAPPSIGSFTDVQYGIKFDKETREPLAYCHKGTWIPADRIYHAKYDARSDFPRGIPLICSIEEDLAEYKDWTKARNLLAIIRSSVGLVKTIKNATKAEIMANAAKGVTGITNDNVSKQKLRPGSIYTVGQNVSLEFLEPKTNAQDSMYDGKRQLENIAASLGQPYYMVSGDSNTQKYAGAMTAEAPALQEFESVQTQTAMHLSEILYRLSILLGFQEDRLDTLKFNVIGVVLRSREELQHAQAMEVKLTNGVISREIWCQEEGLNYDDVKLQIDLENAGIDNVE